MANRILKLLLNYQHDRHSTPRFDSFVNFSLFIPNLESSYVQLLQETSPNCGQSQRENRRKLVIPLGRSFRIRWLVRPIGLVWFLFSSSTQVEVTATSKRVSLVHLLGRHYSPKMVMLRLAYHIKSLKSHVVTRFVSLIFKLKVKLSREILSLFFKIT